MRGFAFCSSVFFFFFFWVAIFLLCFFPAQLALKHRQGKNHKMRIIAFVGSPVEDNEKDVRFKVFYYISCQSHRKKCCFPANNMGLTHSSVVNVCLYFFIFSSCFIPNLLMLQLVKLAKRLKKEKVNVDIINFGEEVRNSQFISHHTAESLIYFLDFHMWNSFPSVNWIVNRLCHLSPPVYPGGEHREADCFYKHFEREGGHRIPSGHGPSGSQSGWCAALLSHPGWWRRLHDGSWCQWLWIWCGSQCWSWAGPGKEHKCIMPGKMIHNLRKNLQGYFYCNCWYLLWWYQKRKEQQLVFVTWSYICR